MMRHAVPGSTRRTCASDGFTLIELMIAVAIIMTVFAAAMPAYSEALDAAKVTRAVGDVRTLSRDVLAYRLTEGALPETILDLDKGDIRDPWGNPYEYLNYAATGNGGGKGNGKKDDGGIPKNPKGARKDKWLKPLNSLYDLYSKGRDGESLPPLSAKVSWDDIVMASDGAFIGLAKDF